MDLFSDKFVLWVKIEVASLMRAAEVAVNLLSAIFSEQTIMSLPFVLMALVGDCNTLYHHK